MEFSIAINLLPTPKSPLHLEKNRLFMTALPTNIIKWRIQQMSIVSVMEELRVLGLNLVLFCMVIFNITIFFSITSLLQRFQLHRPATDGIMGRLLFDHLHLMKQMQ